jgi:uncharacterized membrane protein YeaQ/YmgE (transglycosylase-associated protein family)
VIVIVILVAAVLLLLLWGAIVGLAFHLLWLAIVGVAIGALGRLVLPGKQKLGPLETALVGIAASLLGALLANIFDVGWLIKYIVAVALAAIGVALLDSTTSKRSTGSA